MTRLRGLLLALSSSLLLAMGLPNEVFHYGFPLLGYLALVPLYFALGKAPSYGAAALWTGLYGALHHALSSYWLYFFKGFAFWTIGASTLAYFVVYAFLGLCLVFFLKRTGNARPLAFALLWTSFEYLKSTGFLGYPWGLLPYTQTEVLVLLQIADATGVYGLSFLLALANAAIAESLLGDTHGVAPEGTLVRRSVPYRRLCRVRLEFPVNQRLSAAAQLRILIFALAALALTLGYGLLRLSARLPETPGFNALLIQQNIDPWYEGEEPGIAANLRLARAGLAAADRKPDLILFSESSLRRPFEDFRPWYERKPSADPLLPFIREAGTHLFTGAPIVLDWETFEATNSVILIDPAGRQIGDYAKVHPVPFAEAIPFWEYEGFRRFIQETVGLESGWVMGKEYSLFELPTPGGSIRFGAPICFEDAFSEVCRAFVLNGADLLINLTNDSWSRTVSAEVQHYAAARFRAIELRRPLVRSTNGGLTCLIGPYGETRAALPLFQPAYLNVEIPRVAAPPTLYLRYGDWFARLCLLLSLTWSLILIAKEQMKRRNNQ